MKRICTTCASRGQQVEAKFVASEGGPTALALQWFECAAHGPSDNVAGVYRETLEPIDAVLARAGIPIDALPDFDEDPPPPTERNPTLLEHE